MVLDLLFPYRHRRYSVERLRRLHQDLLSLILVETSTTPVGVTVATADVAAAVKLNDKNRGHVVAAALPPGDDQQMRRQQEQGTTSSNNSKKINNIRDLQSAAFVILAASRQSAEKGEEGSHHHHHHFNHGNGEDARIMVQRDDALVAAFAKAQSMENRVVQYIREMGLVLVHSSSTFSSSSTTNTSSRKGKNNVPSCTVLRSDEVFEYFCQEGILQLLVQIVQAKPGMPMDQQHTHNHCACIMTKSSSKGNGSAVALHGVTWSARVKAQVLSTISLLLSVIRTANDLSALYYMLSQNSLNQLIGNSGMLPLHQWTDPALELMLPVYVELLKTLVLQLGSSPDMLFPFFIIVHNKNNNDTKGNDDDSDDEDDDNVTVSFPLFAATLETGTSTYATQCDSYVHAECLNLVVDLLQIPHVSMQDFVVHHARYEQGQLARYLCRWLCQRATRMVQLTTGPIVDAIRSNALSTQLTSLDDQMQVWNDVFGCCMAMRGGSLHVRLCEHFLQSVARPLLCDLVQATPDEQGYFVCTSFVSSSCRPFLREVGVHDVDVVPNVEARAQVATVVVTRLFRGMAYPPLVRMLAVALLLPQSTNLWFVQKQQPQREPWDLDSELGNEDDEDTILFDVAVTEPLQYEEYANSPSDDNHGHDRTNDNSHEEYILTPALNSLVQGSTASASDGNNSASTDNTTTENLFRLELVKALRGDYGEWRIVSAAILVETILRSPLLDAKTLVKLQILSPGISNSSRWSNNDDNHSSASSSSSSSNITDLESAVATFLADGQHTCKSVVSTVALECMSSLAMYMIYKSAVLYSSMSKQNQDNKHDEQLQTCSSPMWKALRDTRSYFFHQTLESHQALGVSDIFVDLMEAAVQSRYKRVTTTPSWSRSSSNNISHDHGNTTTNPNVRGPYHQQQPGQKQHQQPNEMYAYLLSQHGCAVHGASSEVLIRRLRGVSFNDVEATRFYARMAVHFRAVCRVMERFYQQLDYQSSQQQQNQISPPLSMSSVPKLDLFDEAEELAVIFGALRAKPAVGTEVDLHGRMAFPFSTSVSSSNSAAAEATISSATPSTGRIRTLSGDMIFRPSSRLMLVLDPADMLIVKPTHQQRHSSQLSRTRPRESVINTTERAIVLCCIPLPNVIGSAVDGEWLHVAVRHDNVGSLIKNGNMALLFDSSTGTSLIVQQYLDRCRQVLRRELSEKIKALLSTDTAIDDAVADQHNNDADDNVGDDDDMQKEAKETTTVKELATFPAAPTSGDAKNVIPASKSL